MGHLSNWGLAMVSFLFLLCLILVCLLYAAVVDGILEWARGRKRG